MTCSPLAGPRRQWRSWSANSAAKSSASSSSLSSISSRAATSCRGWTSRRSCIIRMTRHARLRSFAKINLDLRVLDRRPGGFHELRTVFQTISLADSIEIAYEPERRTRIALVDEIGIPDNIIHKAAGAVLDAMRVHARVLVRLKKQIPMGGGLGGGSSDAAAVLLALPVLAGRRLPLDALTSLGSTLGSDVPFFLCGGTAIAVDRGTEVYVLPDIRE